MTFVKHKIYKPSQNNMFTEESQIELSGKYFYSYLNTISNEEKEIGIEDTLRDFKINTLLDKPSNIEVDYEKSFYKIQLNKADWDKIFEADNQLIDYDSIKVFKEKIKQFYE
jgi:hypothetical protein